MFKALNTSDTPLPFLELPEDWPDIQPDTPPGSLCPICIECSCRASDYIDKNIDSVIYDGSYEPAYIQYKEYLCKNTLKYIDVRQLITIAYLAGRGLTFYELVCCNFNMNENTNWRRLTESNFRYLEEFVEKLNHIKSLRIDPLVKDTLISVAHEWVYLKLSAINRPRIEEDFFKSQIIEALAQQYVKCPRCNGDLFSEHTQYLGDLQCLTCVDTNNQPIDIDVKSSEDGSLKHCKIYNSPGHKKFENYRRTRWTVYSEINRGNITSFVLMDCKDRSNDIIPIPNINLEKYLKKCKYYFHQIFIKK